MEPKKKKRKLVDLNTKLAIIKHLSEGHNIRATADKGYPISRPILQAKARQIANKLGVEGGDFSASEGWLHKWKERNNIRSYKISGESENVDLERAEQWKSTLKSLLLGYDLKNVFNMDETGFFFRALSDSTLNHAKQSCKGGKQGKDRVTVVLTCSAMGEKLPPWISGKSKNPRSFRGQDMTQLKELHEIAAQEEELAALACRIGIPQSNLVIEEQLPEFEVVEEGSLIHQLVEEHRDIADDDEVEELAIELEDEDQPAV
ncbi:hypothetical protein R1flu_023327 [Riccia fluitans]|uniref:HTH CENPB-type domain-containing protein n=1 Tax=Riccia fluitans TaxID=41844 RepID=A0ABD1XS92_9MARC